MIFVSKKVMFEVGVYFGAVTGGQNGILASLGGAGTYVFRTHSITFTRNDVYMTSILTIRSSPYIASLIDARLMR